jgi:hypothetical protein
MESQGKAAMNAAQAQAQAGNAAASTTAAIASAGVARAASTCACNRKGCPACDMLARVHSVEAIVPPTFNPWTEMLAASREIVRLNTQIARLLQRWDSEGLPSRRGEV